MQHKKILAKAVIPALMVGGLSFSYQAFAAGSIADAINNGKASGDFNLRYEAHDNDDGVLDEATAITLRSRLGYMTDDYEGFKAFLEFEDVRAIEDEYSPEDPTFDTVADPEDTEVNQAFVSYSGLADTSIIGGRQRIKLDNDRWVGNVGWRQDEQTYNALRINNSSLTNTTLTYAFVDKVYGILGDVTQDLEAHLLNAGIDKLGPGKLTAYIYLIDNEGGAGDGSTQTMGLRYAGKVDLGGNNLKFAVEYAQQSDYADATSFDADYMLVEIGADVQMVNVTFGYEVLGSDDGTAGLQTQFATKHAFNGWADKFLTTPAGGLVDMYLALGANVAGFNAKLVYHDFSADDDAAGPDNYGDEIDFLVTKKVTDNVTAGLKVTSYSADDFSVDSDKFVVWGNYKF